MKIGITYNLKDELLPEAILDDEACEEFDTENTIEALSAVFEKKGHRTVRLPWGNGNAERLAEEKPDFVFNIAEGGRGRNRESQIPALLEMLGIPYSGSDPLTLGLALDKSAAKKILSHAGIPTPRYMVLDGAGGVPPVREKLRYPLIVKPAWEGSSKGIYRSSRVHDQKGLEAAAKRLFEKYPKQPVMVEEYIGGREITVGVIGNDPPLILGMMEVVDKEAPGPDFFYSIEVKRDWKRLVDYVSPPDLTRIPENHIRHYALSAFREFGCRDVARMDFRLSPYDGPFLLEVNPLPGLSPEYADLVIMAGKSGISYDDLVLSILDHALARHKGAGDGVRYEKV